MILNEYSFSKLKNIDSSVQSVGIWLLALALEQDQIRRQGCLRSARRMRALPDACVLDVRSLMRAARASFQLVR